MRLLILLDLKEFQNPAFPELEDRIVLVDLKIVA